jgi:outer membrane protein OmpA-like peptidoglycan-associated protein
MKSYLSCLLVFLALHAPAQAQSPVSGQVATPPASASNDTVLRNLGEGYAALQRNDLQAAEKYFLVVRRIEPNNIWGALNLAVVLQRQSRFAEARTMYTEVLALDKGTERAAQASQTAYAAAGPAEIARANMALLGAEPNAATKKCAPVVRGPSMRFASEIPASGCPALISDIRFVFNKAEPTPEGQAALLTLKDHLKQTSSLHVRGYTDDQGIEAFNRPLAEKRAAYVAEWLSRQGVRVTSQSAHSMCCYIAPQATLQARKTNRRVEVEFTQE